MSSRSRRPLIPSPEFLEPQLPSGDLREKITARRRSRSNSYSPPPPPSHPSRYGRSSCSPRPPPPPTNLSSHVSRSVSRSRQESKSLTRSHKSRRKDRSRSRSKAKSKRRKSHHKRVKSSKRKSKRKSRSSSSSSSEREMSKSKALKQSIASLLQDNFEPRNSVKTVRRRTKSGESRESISSRDEPSTSVSRMSEPVNLLPNPIQPTEEFMPVSESGGDLPGYTKCKICSTYYPAKEEDERMHLSQHSDRLFRVNVPTDIYFYNVGDVIKHLARMKFESSQLQEKVAQCNLLRFPTNLRGYSCDLCRKLDTNELRIFLSHFREECQVRGKAERLEHLICFCRGCQGRFARVEDLEEHLQAGPCWPRKITIHRLYDEVKHEAPPSAVPAQLVRVKQEPQETGVTGLASASTVTAPTQFPNPGVKREAVEPRIAASMSFSQIPSETSLNTPDLPYQPQHQMTPFQANASVFQSPVTPASHSIPAQFSQPLSNTANFSQFSQPPPTPVNFSQPPPTNPFSWNSTSVPHIAPPQGFFGVQQPTQSGKSTGGPGLPTYSNYAPPIKSEVNSVQSLPRPVPCSVTAQVEPPVPSPAFSPVKQEGRRSNSVVAPPTPAQPLPSASDLFSVFSPPVEAEEEVVELARTASSLNCKRLLCNWTDPHMDSCKRLRIQKKCESGDCKPGDLHAITGNKANPTMCQKLLENCNGWKGNKEMKIISLLCPHNADKSCREGPAVSMRLMYRRNNPSLQDPRLNRSDYATSSQAARTISSRARGAAWEMETLISTWSAVSMIRVVPGENPHHEDSDDSDLECLN